MPSCTHYQLIDAYHRSKTYESLSKAGIPCTVILDSAVAYAMGKVDLVLVGSEAVVESGGLINAVGSYQMALIAKAAHVPFYALAERSVCQDTFRPNAHLTFPLCSYKFHRMFPLSQYDLPTHTDAILSFSIPANAKSLRPSPTQAKLSAHTVPRSAALPQSAAAALTEEQLKRNPEVDYTKYAMLISLLPRKLTFFN